jgi:Tfp pilus assembly protein PilF
MLAFIYYFRGQETLAISHYEKAVTQKFKIRNYSRKMALIFNNMGVLEYYLGQYEKSLLMLHRGFKLG